MSVSLGVLGSETICQSLKGEISIFYSTLGSLVISPIGFSKLGILGACLLHSSQRLVSDVEDQPLAPL